MIQSQSAAHAKAYFSDALAKSDYYLSDQELEGFWQGKLADRLRLSGATDKDAFFAMCENRHPMTGEALTPRMREERTTGYDINFHCPKSVSVLHAFSNDDHILEAFQQSVTKTMVAIEADSETRVRRNGAYADRKTGELAWAHFTHQTARPVDGSLPDPHLHSHCFVFNATWDAEEQRIKAGQFRNIKRDMPYYQAMFHKFLSDNLLDLGYTIRRTDKSFEIDGVPEKVTDLFSKRTDEIGRIAKEKGITDEKELAELGARTRAKKQKGHSMAELKEEWREQIRELGREGQGGSIVRHSPEKVMLSISPEQCVEHAALHCFERASVMADRRFLAVAYRQSLGNSDVKLEAVSQAFEKDSSLIHVQEGNRSFCTTKAVMSEEMRMVELAKQGQGMLAPLYRQAPALSLEGQQARAVEHVLTTPHRVSIIRGAAGTGKTTLMKEAVAKFEEAGKTVIVIAPTAQASRGVLKEEGFAGAETVAKFLSDNTMKEKLKNQILWVDEAGLLGTKEATAILEVATKANARIIFGGDTLQHSAVTRGDALRIINTVAGIKSAEVNKIYRQKNEAYKSAVKDLSEGDVGKAFQKLDEMGWVISVDPLNSTQRFVTEYVESLKEGKSAIVISPTHAQGEEITASIRGRLKEEGLLGKKDLTVKQLKNLNWTEAEKKDLRNYKEGNVVKFNQNVTGFSRGSVWHVGADENTLHLVDEKGKKNTLPIDKSEHYTVYAERELKLSKGDKVMITDNAFDQDGKRLNNGAMLEVVNIASGGKIELRNGNSKSIFTLDKNFGSIAHAHCITSYASQGRTVDHVYIYQPSATFPATDAKQFYVSVSRAKEKAKIFTDDKEALMLHAGELGDRRSAIELTSQSKHKDYAVQTQRFDHLKGNEIIGKETKEHELDR